MISPFAFSNPGYPLVKTSPDYCETWPNTLRFGNSATFLPNNSAFTFETWLYVNAFANVAGYSGSDTVQTIYLSSGTGGYTIFFRLIISAGTAYVHAYNYNGGGSPATAKMITPGNWNHVRLTYDPATPFLRIDVNNVQQAITTLTGAIKPVSTIYLGHVDSNRGANALNGMMDETRVWPYVRTDAQNAASWQKHNADLSDLSTGIAAFSWQRRANSTAFPGGYNDETGHGFGCSSSANGYEGTQTITTVPFA